jgi:SAM-dependent methyltransferase
MREGLLTDTADYGNWQKYQHENPLQRTLLTRFRAAVQELVSELSPTSILDVGCAEGFILHDIQDRFPHAALLGVDTDASALERGRRIHPALDLRAGDAYHLTFEDATFDLVLCLETLEHLTDPERALEELRRVSRGYALLSVPHEPLFRLANLLRGKHAQAWGNDPEHLHSWTPSSFRRLVAPHWKLIRERKLFPWFLILAEK